MIGSVQEELKGMTLEEQVEYLVAIVDGPLVAKAYLVDTMGMWFQTNPSLVLHRLTTRPGRTVQYVDLIDICDFSETVKNPRLALASAVKRLRRTLEKYGLPIQIETLYGVGYRAVFTDANFRFPWTLADQVDGNMAYSGVGHSFSFA